MIQEPTPHELRQVALVETRVITGLKRLDTMRAEGKNINTLERVLSRDTDLVTKMLGDLDDKYHLDPTILQEMIDG